MAQRHARLGRNKRTGGLHTLGPRDWETQAKRLRLWVREHQNVAVFQSSDKRWTLVRPELYLDAGILGAFRFSEQRTIAESILGL